MRLGKLLTRGGLILMVFFISVTMGFAQDKDKNKRYKYEFCSGDSWSNGDRVSVKDLREMTIPSAYELKVNSKNGRITVKGENRSDVMVRACVKTYADSKAEADSLARAVRILTSPEVRAENTPDENWSVSYEIRVPNSQNLDLSSGNGRITISDVQGQMNFKSGNGRITLDNVGGNIKGRTNNGRVTVKLGGFAWNGNGMDIETGNGRITLYMPANYAANVDVETSNGRFSSDFAELQMPKEATRRERRSGPKRVTASINGGGAPIRLVTTNGRVTIKSKESKQVRY